jgi:iron complex outermembrane receptor protein
LLALIAVPAAVRAQTGAIAGRVTDSTTAEPLAGATVRAVSGMTTAGQSIAGEDGSYRIVNLAPGTYDVAVARLGYLARRVTGVRVTAGEVAQVEVRMSEIVTQLNPAQITAGRQEQKVLDAPASITVLETREISQRPSVTVADHLKGVPGVDINAGGIAQANIVARGFNNAFSGSLLMLQDYRFAAVPSLRVNVPFLFTGTNEDIERMEVLLGPASALYGPNSANGVLHIITKSPFTSQGTTLTLDGGERSILRGSGRHAGLIGSKAGYKLSGEYFTGTDWKYFDPGEPGTYPAEAPPSRRGQEVARDFDVERYTGEARLDLRPRDNIEAITTYGFTKALGGVELTAANGTGQIKNWTYQSIQQRFRWNRLFAQVFLNFSDAGNEDSLSSEGTYLFRSGQAIVDQSRTYAAQLQHVTDLGATPDRGPKHSFVYGLDYIFTNPRTGGTINGRNEDIDDVSEVGAYVQYTGRLADKFEVVGALRGDRNDQVEGTQVSPRLALIFRPTETQNIRATYNRAFNTPQNFSFFLDLINSRNIGGSGFDVRAQGNPPKEGWQFARTCTTSPFGGLCMKSRLAGGGAFIDASSAAAFPGFFTVQQTAIRTGLQQALGAALPAPQAAAIAADLAAYFTTLRPTATNVGTVVRYLDRPTVALQPADVRDIAALKASFNNTYELGYKGILGNRARLAVDLWYQQRGDVGAPASLATPNVFFDPQTLGAYLGTSIATRLVTQFGLPQATAAAIAAQAAPVLTQSAARAPLGVITFDSPLAGPGDVIATYQTINEKVNIQGVDLAFDYIFSPRWNMAATYGWVSDVIFEDVRDAQGNALALNAPDHKASLTARWVDEVRGLSLETRGRYANTFPVNSGVYASNRSFVAPAVLNPNVPAGTYQTNNGVTTYTYPAVPVNMFLDVGFSWRVPVRGTQQITWSVNGTNVLDNKRATFAGVPEIGRMVMTRIQYAF